MGISEKLIITNTAKQNIKQAIIDKGVDMTAVPFTSYHTKIAEITGGGTPPVTANPLVRFFDYDGTILKEEEVEIGNDATAPTLPDYSVAAYRRPALTFQTWNNELTNIQHDLDVAPIYIPTDGKTHFYVYIGTIASNLTLRVYLSTSSTEITIDWGDSTQTIINNTSGYTVNTHAYSVIGDYEITVWRSSATGSVTFGASSYTSPILSFPSNSALINAYLCAGIGEGGFKDSSFLETVTFPSDVSVRSYAFENCGSLKFFAQNSSTINALYVFNSCYSLQNVSFRDFASVWTSTFNNCQVLRTVIVGVTGLARDGAFKGCTNLKKVVVVNNSTVGKIGYETFSGCSSLRELILPDSVTSISYRAFYNCGCLESVGGLDNVLTIEQEAFYGCKNLESVGSLLNATTIIAGAFNGCTNLFKDLDSIPALSSYGSALFYGVRSLTTAIIKEGVASLSTNCLYNTPVDYLDMPSTITSISTIGVSASNIIICRAVTPPTLAGTTSAFGYYYRVRIFVPDDSVDDYKAATNWTYYSDRIFPLSTL